MKQNRFLWILMLLTLFLISGCSHQTPPEPSGTEFQTLHSEPETFPTEVTEEKSYPDMEEEVFALGFVTADSIDSNTPCKIRTRKYRKEHADDICYALYIEVDTGLQVLKMELAPESFPNPGGCEVLFGDVDGDEIQEILVHHNTGGVGGFGIWEVWVLKVEGKEIKTLFYNCSEFDTGFESQFLEGYQMEVKNRLTGYSLVFDVKASYKACIDGSDTLLDDEIWLDPFYFFEPQDTDNDGISEILCKQYTSVFGHADYTGTACSVLKFNTQAQVFEVVDAWYEPHVEE